ncbi:MAG: hypothetical protein RMM06_05720 [Armatimonadota bacterium]|nr:hypothetical protein [Armatimonadota bacterium]
MPGYWDRICLAFAMLAFLIGLVAEAQRGKTDRVFTSGRLSITIPEGWERKPGELVFRTGRGTQQLRFIAVSEEAVARGYTPQKYAEMLEHTALSLEGVSIVTASSTRIDGRQARAVEFRRTQKGKASLRGKHITVPLRDSVVTIFWYVSDWRKGREEMERIVKTIRIR